MITPDVATAVFESLPDATAVLDTDGQILATNLAWRMFSIDNGGHPDSTDVGVNYLEVCDQSVTAAGHDASQVAIDLRAVLAGTLVEAGLEYRCPAPDKRRWFAVRINRLPGARPGAIVAHRNITNRKIAEETLRPLADIVDPLTGLATRAVLENHLAAVLADKNTSGTPGPAVIRCRVDGHHTVTATFGHVAADETL